MGTGTHTQPLHLQQSTNRLRLKAQASRLGFAKARVETNPGTSTQAMQHSASTPPVRHTPLQGEVLRADLQLGEVPVQLGQLLGELLLQLPALLERQRCVGREAHVQVEPVR